MAEAQTESKFIQIAATVAPQSPTLLYALDESGIVWLFNFSKKRWSRLSSERET